MITVVSISGIAIYQVNKKNYDDYLINSKEQMSTVSQAINIFYDQIDKNLNMIATNPLVMTADESITSYKNTTAETQMKPSESGELEKAIYKVFEQYGNSHEGTNYVYLGTKDGRYIQWPETTTFAGYDPVIRPWYVEAEKKNGNIIRTEPYTFKSEMLTSNARTFTNKDGKVIAASSEELTATSEQAASTSEEVAKTIEEIAKGASDQARDTEVTANNVEDLGNLLEEDSNYTKELNLAAVQIEKEKEDGFLILKKLINKTQENRDASSNVYEIIMSNNESAEKIENVSSMIQSIADQTNLLALNAAIEAAGAGEAGKGFAVVADEVRKLAEQSNNFTNDIKTIINELKIKSQKAVDLMQQTNQVVEEQSNSVEATKGKFEGIAEAIDVIKIIITKLNNSTSLMADNKNKIIDLTQNLAAISEENAAGTEQAAESMEEQAATIQEIASSGEKLATIAEELRISIEKFKI